MQASKPEAKGFHNSPLAGAALIGAVRPTTARLWVRAERPTSVRLEWYPEMKPGQVVSRQAEIGCTNDSDNTLAVEIEGLRSLTRYAYRVVDERTQSLLGAGRFDTSPQDASSSPRKFSIGVCSCNQPFTEQGKVREGAREMLQAALECFRQNDTKLAFLVGDQMYSDRPKAFSLFDKGYFQSVAPDGMKAIHECPTDIVRRLYQDRYRQFWGIPEWLALQAEIPCYPTWDDHEIIDNWGSDPKHQESTWHSVGQGSRLACHDYQFSRVMPFREEVASHYVVEYGNTATFVMDLRTERRAGSNGRLISEAQTADFEKFLNDNGDKCAIFLALSVPPVHLPRSLSNGLAWLTPSGEDFSDRWSTGRHVRDRDNMFRLLREHQERHPDQHIVILSGDIHIACVHTIRWHDNRRLRPIHQLIASGITHHASRFIVEASKVLIGSNRSLKTESGDLTAKVRLLRGIDNLEENPLGKLNLGLVEIETDDEGRCSLRFRLYSHRDGEPVCHFESPAIQ